MKRVMWILVVPFVLAVLSGCASNLSGESFSRDEARKPQQVKIGVVEFVRPVVIEGTKTPIGAGAGAVVGGIAGSTVGGGKGSSIATVVGAVVGGVAGAAAEEQVTKTQGVEITVRFEDGKILAIVQAASEKETFAVGDRVRVLTVKGNTRVSH